MNLVIEENKEMDCLIKIHSLRIRRISYRDILKFMAMDQKFASNISLDTRDHILQFWEFAGSRIEEIINVEEFN